MKNVSSVLVKKNEDKRQVLLDKHLNKVHRKNQQYLDKKYLDELEVLKSDVYYTTDQLRRINEENYQIIKDNRLIQKATFNFTELELKCLNYTLSRIKPDSKLSENDWIEYKLRDLIKMLNLKDSSASVQLIKDSLSNLRTKGKWIKIETEKEKKEVNLSFFLKCEIDNTNGKNIVRIRLMQEILDYLQNLHNNFTTQYLIYTMRLKGKYAIRLYELCKSYQNNYIKEFDIFGFNLYLEKIRSKWCIEKSYRNNDIKRTVECAINEINKKTDIQVSIYNSHKDGRMIDYYVIRVEPNSNFQQIYKDIKNERKV